MKSLFIFLIVSLFFSCSDSTKPVPDALESSAQVVEEVQYFTLVFDEIKTRADLAAVTYSIDSIIDTTVSIMLDSNTLDSFFIPLTESGNVTVITVLCYTAGVLVADLHDTIIGQVSASGKPNRIPQLWAGADTTVEAGEKLFFNPVIDDDDTFLTLSYDFLGTGTFVPDTDRRYSIYTDVDSVSVIIKVEDSCHVVYDTVLVVVIEPPAPVVEDVPEPELPDTLEIISNAITAVVSVFDSVSQSKRVTVSVSGFGIETGLEKELGGVSPNYVDVIDVFLRDTSYSAELYIYDTLEHFTGYYSQEFRGTDSIIDFGTVFAQNGFPTLSLTGDSIVNIYDTVSFVAQYTDAPFGDSALNIDWNVEGFVGAMSGDTFSFVIQGTPIDSLPVYCTVVDGDENTLVKVRYLTVVLDAPSVFAGNDTTISAQSQYAFRAVDVDQYGSVVNIAWDFNGLDGISEFETVTDVRVDNLAADSVLGIVRVTDDDGLIAHDTVAVNQLVSSVTQRDIHELTVQWSGALSKEFTCYDIYYSKDSTQLMSGVPNETICDRFITEKKFSKLEHNTTYYFAATIIQGTVGDTVFSNIISGATHHQGFTETSLPYVILTDAIQDSVHFRYNDSILFEDTLRIFGGGATGAWPWEGYDDPDYQHFPILTTVTDSNFCTEGKRCLMAEFFETNKEPGSIFFYYPDPEDSTKAFRRDLKYWHKHNLVFDVYTTENIEVKVSSRESDLLNQSDPDDKDVVVPIFEYGATDSLGWETVTIPLSTFTGADFTNIKVAFFAQYHNNGVVYFDNIRYEAP